MFGFNRAVFFVAKGYIFWACISRRQAPWRKVCRRLHVRGRRHGCGRTVRGSLIKIQKPLLYPGFPLLVIVFPFIRVAMAGNDRMLKGEAGIVDALVVAAPSG